MLSPLQFFKEQPNRIVIEILSEEDELDNKCRDLLRILSPHEFQISSWLEAEGHLIHTEILGDRKDIQNLSIFLRAALKAEIDVMIDKQ